MRGISEIYRMADEEAVPFVVSNPRSPPRRRMS
jgi:hypothetical protein